MDGAVRIVVAVLSGVTENPILYSCVGWGCELGILNIMAHLKVVLSFWVCRLWKEIDVFILEIEKRCQDKQERVWPCDTPIRSLGGMCRSEITNRTMMSSSRSMMWKFYVRESISGWVPSVYTCPCRIASLYYLTCCRVFDQELVSKVWLLPRWTTVQLVFSAVVKGEWGVVLA